MVFDVLVFLFFFRSVVPVAVRVVFCAARREQQAMTGLLSDWQMARPNRAVITLAGDVHIGGFTDSWVRGLPA